MISASRFRFAVYHLGSKLYISIGDGGYAGDPHNHGQNLASLFGSILRIDVNTKDGYIVPQDNPYYRNKNYSDKGSL